MLLIIKSSPDTPDGKRGIKLARDTASDVCLMQSAVYFAQKDRLEGFCGKVYILDEDAKLRGLRDEEIEKDIRKIDYDKFVELMAGEDKVVGIF